MKVAAHPFGQLLDQIMHDHGLTQGELAARLGYSQGWIAHVRTGHKAPNYPMARRIAAAFPEHDKHVVYDLIEDARTRLGVTRTLFVPMLDGLENAA